MTHEPPIDQYPSHPLACHWSGSASAYLMGSLVGEPLRTFLEHLEAGCAECREELSEDREALAILDATEMWQTQELVAPSANLLEGIKQQLHAHPGQQEPELQTWRRWQPQSNIQVNAGLLTVQADQGEWEELAIPGIFVRRLAVDAERRLVTMMIRMQPGTQYPPHRHAAVEECYVIAGDLHVGALSLRAGDYQRAELGSIHEVQWTEGGCTLLLVSSQDDELVA